MKILAPLDGSRRSQKALHKALGLLDPGARVTLMCVQNEGFDEADEDRVAMFDDDEDDEIFPTEDSAARMLDEVAAECAKAGREVETLIVKGNVRKQIMKVVAQDHYDLVIMHRLDKSGLKEKLKMSGTEWLCRNLPCSALLVDD